MGTETDGLHILRDRRFLTFGAREGPASNATTTVVDDRSGTLWVGTMGSGLNALPLPQGSAADGSFPGKKAIWTYTVQDGLVSNVILSLAAAPNGDLWVGTPDGLNRIRHGSIATFTSADGPPDDFIRSLLVDADGSLWVGTRHGLAHWTNPGRADAQMRIYTQTSGLGSDLVGAMARDTRGNLWVATLSALSRLRGGAIANFTTASGLSSDVVTSLLPRPDGTLLIGTENHGLDVWDGRRFFAVAGSGLSNTTIRTVHAGKSRIPPAIAELLAERLGAEELTPREFDVLEQIVHGKSNKEIGTELDISEATVKTHVNSLLGKLGVTDRTQAATAAIRRGIVPFESPRKPKP